MQENTQITEKQSELEDATVTAAKDNIVMMPPDSDDDLPLIPLMRQKVSKHS
jgi:hypothetical protein